VLAARILAINDQEITEALRQFSREMEEQVAAKNQALQQSKGQTAA
jgi:phosphoribosylcarboxyaminoimidazole (NCAIR) mutase